MKLNETWHNCVKFDPLSAEMLSVKLFLKLFFFLVGGFLSTTFLTVSKANNNSLDLFKNHILKSTFDGLCFSKEAFYTNIYTDFCVVLTSTTTPKIFLQSF